MTHLSISQARSHLADIVNKVAYTGERICIERNGKNFVALVPVDDIELLELIEDRMDIEAAKKAMKRKDAIPWKQLKKELGL